MRLKRLSVFILAMMLAVCFMPQMAQTASADSGDTLITELYITTDEWKPGSKAPLEATFRSVPKGAVPSSATLMVGKMIEKSDGYYSYRSLNEDSVLEYGATYKINDAFFSDMLPNSGYYIEEPYTVVYLNGEQIQDGMINSLGCISVEQLVMDLKEPEVGAVPAATAKISAVPAEAVAGGSRTEELMWFESSTGTGFNDIEEMSTDTFREGMYYYATPKSGPAKIFKQGYSYGTNSTFCVNGKLIDRKDPRSMFFGPLGTTYTVSFDANGHGTAPAAQKVNAGSAAKTPASPSASGYVFTGWYTDKACTKKYEFNSGVRASMTLYAGWKESASGLGADGTALGTGASFAAVDKALRSLKNDSDPKGSVFGKLRLKAAKAKKKSIKLKWKSVSGATKYVVYANKCGKKNKLIKVAQTAKKTYTLKKLNKKALKKGTYYKFTVVALDKNNKVVSTSTIIHEATLGGKVGNHKSVTTKAKKNKVKIKAKKTFKLKAKAKAASKKLKVKKHVGVRYESSNTKIATVSKKGVIKGVKKGKCYVYAYAQNGVMKRIKVTVR